MGDDGSGRGGRPALASSEITVAANSGVCPSIQVRMDRAAASVSASVAELGGKGLPSVRLKASGGVGGLAGVVTMSEVSVGTALPVVGAVEREGPVAVAVPVEGVVVEDVPLAAVGVVAGI